ncbi:tetratricopeptide repeat protein [Persicitalea jodogahamensis]|uniref:tetratricopeptide repeat protein n=1 Tax=Persicitalea jodogahamensis TaxID=402147 RepID=UPI001E5C6741|nr:tetratricopeptide repeat protein [Persicitalea jodogahamensis]
MAVSQPVQAQDFRECQELFEKLLKDFNQSFAENNPQIIHSTEYRRELIALKKSYQSYHKAYFNPSDSIQKFNNEAMLNTLSGNYGKALRLLSSIDSLDPQTNYSVGLLHLLNGNYSSALPLLGNSDASKSAPLNTLVVYCKQGRVSDGLAYGQSAAHGNTQGKWNYNLGLLYKMTDRLEESVAETTTAIRQSDEMAYRLLRGDALMKLKQAKRAVSDFEKMARKYPKAQIRYANALVDLHRYQEASYVFQEYLQGQDPTFRKDAFLGLGHAYYGLNQMDNAQKYYRLAATMIRDSPVALCGQANVLVTKHEYQAAQTLYNRILSNDSTYLSAKLGRGITQYGLGNYREALLDMKAADILFDPADRALADIFVCRGFARYYTGNAGAALADFESALRLDGGRFEALAGLSSIYVDQKNYSEAGRYMTKALGFEKSYDRMWSNYGNMLLHFDMHKKSLDVFKKAIALNPENIKAQNGWGIVQLESDKLNQSKVLFDSLVKANPDVPYLLNNRGIVNAYHGNRFDQLDQPEAADNQYQLAFDDFKAAMEVAPSRKFYNVNQGNVYRYWQQYEDAKLSYQKHQDKSALNNTAVLYAGLDNNKDAKYYLETALQIDSAHRVFQFNMNLLLKGRQKEFAQSLARTVASNDDTDGPFSDIGIKYSRDGFVTIFLYDYEYDTLHFPGRHFLPLPVAEYTEEYFIPEYDFKLMPYSIKKAPKEKTKKPRYKSQKVRMRGGRKRSGTDCPVF